MLLGLKNWARFWRSCPRSNLGHDRPVSQGLFAVLGLADLSINITHEKAVRQAENLVLSRFSLESDKAEGLGLYPARHRAEHGDLSKHLEIVQKGFF